MRIAEAGALCGILVASDMACRSLRLRLLLALAVPGRGMRLRDALLATTFGDAAAAVTPMRAGGGPARLLVLRRSGVRLPAALAVLAADLAASLVLAVPLGALLFWHLVPDGAAAARRLWGTGRAPLVAAGLLVAALALGTAAARVRGSAPRLVRLATEVRGALRWQLLACVPLTAASVASRLALLPVLLQTLPSPAAPGDALRASFLLLFGQLLVPSPSGVGAVELAFLSGMVGDLGGVGPAFVLWRACTVGVPVTVGFGLALHVHGRKAVLQVLRTRRHRGRRSPPERE